MKNLKDLLAENMHRFGTKNLNEDEDQNNNGYPDSNETTKSTIIHTNAHGYVETIDLDLTQFNDFIMSRTFPKVNLLGINFFIQAEMSEHCLEL